MATLGLILLFLAYVVAIIGSFAVFWPLTLWLRSGRLGLFGRIVIFGLPAFIGALLALSPLARRQVITTTESYQQTLTASLIILAGLALAYLVAILIGKLTSRLDRWLLVAVPVWLLTVIALTFDWALAFYYLAGALDCSPGAYECP